MNGYWPYFGRNFRCNRGCPGNCNHMPVHLNPQNESLNTEQSATDSLAPEIHMDIGNECDQTSKKSTRPEPEIPQKTPYVIPNNFSMKSSSLGSIIIPANTEIGTVYDIASINIQTSCFDRFHIRLCFSCNLITTNAKINLNFRIYKRGNVLSGQIPVGCNYDFFRDKESNESNALSFTACDYDSFRDEYCNYSVYAKVTGITTSGTISVSNPILSASLVELP